MNIEVSEKQKLFMDATDVDEVLFGGAAGGGKSYVQVLDNLVYAINYPGIKQLILRRTYPELEKSLIRTALGLYPKEIYRYNSSKHTMEFVNGSITDFGYCDKENDVFAYQSLEYDVIRFDEGTHFTQFMYEYLETRIRGANDFPKQRKVTSNPGNVGHQYFKSRFVDIAPPMEKYTYSLPGSSKTKTRLYIPARVYDNKFIMEKDPEYVLRLESQPEEIRKALLDGSWDLYEGQYFPEFSRDIHVCQPFPIPEHWRIYFTMDYGLDMLAGYWIAVDEMNRGYVVAEVYKPNLIISDAAKLIRSTTRLLGYRVQEHLAPPDLWNRRQETGKSVADIFREHGIILRKTSNDRIDGWMATKEWLKPFKDEQGITVAPLRIFPTCVNLIRCLPALQHHPRKPNDIATEPHEITHAPDAIRGFCVYRSRGPRKRPPLDEENYREQMAESAFANNDMFDVYGRSESIDEQFNAIADDSDIWY